jgi:hypothetical protein
MIDWIDILLTHLCSVKRLWHVDYLCRHAVQSTWRHKDVSGWLFRVQWRSNHMKVQPNDKLLSEYHAIQNMLFLLVCDSIWSIVQMIYLRVHNLYADPYNLYTLSKKMKNKNLVDSQMNSNLDVLCSIFFHLTARMQLICVIVECNSFSYICRDWAWGVFFSIFSCFSRLFLL